MSSRNKNIELGTKELEQMQKELQEFKKRLIIASEKTVNDLAEFGLDKMQEIYNSSGVEDSTPMDFSIEGDSLEKTVQMSGEQALYDEFGTGTIGSENPHPAKSNFNLNPYNSGSTIRKNESATSAASLNGIPVGALYWTYTDSNGNKVYTQGIAAQKEGYDSLKETIEKVPEIFKQRMEEA